MDEILIEDKKYVSSKQAAKLTGYAKDYVGQLCREGRVPARLVGRSWYVLESAIHDHRFSEQKVAASKPLRAAADDKTQVTSAWEAPRYEPAHDVELPSINRINTAVPAQTEQDKRDSVSSQLQDSWRAWFDRVAEAPAAPSVPDVIPEPREKEDTPTEQEDRVEEEVRVPIHTLYEQPPEALLPKAIWSRPSIETEREEFSSVSRKRGKKGFGIRAATLVGSIFAVILVAIAVINSGFIDSYTSALSTVGTFSGISVYNR